MWNAAGNNLIVPAPAAELTVNVPAANPLFNVVPGGGGVNKIATPAFTRLHGNVFLCLSVACVAGGFVGV